MGQAVALVTGVRPDPDVLDVLDGLTPDILAAVTNKFSRRMQLVKDAALKRGLTDLHGQTIDFMLELWLEAKAAETK